MGTKGLFQDLAIDCLAARKRYMCPISAGTGEDQVSVDGGEL